MGSLFPFCKYFLRQHTLVGLFRKNEDFEYDTIKVIFLNADFLVQIHQYCKFY